MVMYLWVLRKDKYLYEVINKEEICEVLKNQLKLKDCRKRCEESRAHTAGFECIQFGHRANNITSTIDRSKLSSKCGG